MKIDILQKILSVDGIKALSNQETKCDLTLKEVCITAVLQPGKDDTEKQKYAAYELFVKIRDCKTNELELSTEEIVQIKKKIGLIYVPLILGQAFDLLEGKGQK